MSKILPAEEFYDKSKHYSILDIMIDFFLNTVAITLGFGVGLVIFIKFMDLVVFIQSKIKNNEN